PARRFRRRAARAEIVDDDLCAARGEAQRVAAPQSAARAGDDGDAAVEANIHCQISVSARAGRGISRFLRRRKARAPTRLARARATARDDGTAPEARMFRRTLLIVAMLALSTATLQAGEA